MENILKDDVYRHSGLKGFKGFMKGFHSRIQIHVFYERPPLQKAVATRHFLQIEEIALGSILKF